MRGSKINEFENERIELDSWPWVVPEYTVSLPFKKTDIKYIEIDPSQRLADVDRENNFYEN